MTDSTTDTDRVIGEASARAVLDDENRALNRNPEGLNELRDLLEQTNPLEEPEIYDALFALYLIGLAELPETAPFTGEGDRWANGITRVDEE